MEQGEEAVTAERKEDKGDMIVKKVKEMGPPPLYSSRMGHR